MGSVDNPEEPTAAQRYKLLQALDMRTLNFGAGEADAPALGDGTYLLAPSGVLLAGTHVGGVISFGLGAISFTHVLKATEPVWSALLSAVFFKEFLPLPVYASLLPVIGGVCLASVKEVDFAWEALLTALTANLFAAFKANENKKLMDTPGIKVGLRM